MKLVHGLDLFKDVSSKPGSRLIGIYTGSTRIGICISCPENKLGFRLGVLRREDDIMLHASKLKKWVSDYSVHGFVVGNSYEEGVQTELDSQVKEWVDKLCETKELEAVEYTYCHQTLGRDIAAEMDELAKLSPCMREAVLDVHAAAVILEGYLHVARNYDDSE